MTSIHKGHRERFRARARSAGLQTFEPHEVIELLLMQIIPQKDVNQLAHLLINEFGSVREVLEADETALSRVPGVGPKTAKWFHDVYNLINTYARSPVVAAYQITRLHEAREYMSGRMRDGEEGLLLSYLDFSGHVIHTTQFPEESKRYPVISDIVSAAIRHHAHSILTARLYPRERLPDEIKESDKRFVTKLAEALRLIGLELLDHLTCDSADSLSIQAEEGERILKLIAAGDEEKAAAESAIPAPRNENIILNMVIRDGKDWLEGEPLSETSPQE